MKFIAALPLFALLPACAPQGDFPSLAVRPIEAKAAGLLADPATKPDKIIPSDAALRARIAAVRQGALASTADFESARTKAEKSAATAGSAQSESWIAAEMDISNVERARGPVKTALAELDSILRTLMTGPATSPDLPIVQQAIRDVESLDAAQNAATQKLRAAVER